jgi:phthiodiolone/phenolphthiodiolone dimycocerosates ketoreductase
MLQAPGRYADAWVPFILTRSTDYAQALETVRAAASDAGRDPMSIMPAVVRAVVTDRNRDDVDEVLDSVKGLAASLPYLKILRRLKNL